MCLLIRRVWSQQGRTSSEGDVPEMWRWRPEPVTVSADHPGITMLWLEEMDVVFFF